MLRGMPVICRAVMGLAVSLSMNIATAADANGAVPEALTVEKSFIEENAAAMDKMMAGMDIAPTGDIDRDFVNTMIAHHQGAIDMAVTLLKYGHNEQLKRIAQEIIVDQQQEIAAMRLAIGDPLPPSTAAPTQTPAQQQQQQQQQQPANDREELQ